MGKAADNERIKLRALFCTNIGSGVAVAGFFIPCLVFWLEGLVPSSPKGIIAGVTLILSLVVAIGFARAADHIVRDLKD